jgi:hypothetical protein
MRDRRRLERVAGDQGAQGARHCGCLLREDANIGGLWCIDNRAFGAGAAYDSLHINTDTRMMEYRNHPMPRVRSGRSKGARCALSMALRRKSMRSSGAPAQAGATLDINGGVYAS